MSKIVQAGVHEVVGVRKGLIKVHRVQDVSREDTKGREEKEIEMGESRRRAEEEEGCSIRVLEEV